MSLVSLILYIPLQILFLPMTLFGVIYVGYRQIVISKKMGISQTAVEVLNGRWTMHIFGMRTDQACDKLAKVLPNDSIFGLWLVLLPLWLKYRISGELFLYPRMPAQGDEDARDLVTARTVYFDDVIKSTINKVDQFVILGAGYDTRAYGESMSQNVAIFELDQMAVQQHKIHALKMAGIASDHVRFVAIDFAREDVFAKLIDAGFDTTKKTLFLMEGVTLYLSEEDVRNTMRHVRKNAPNGSVLLMDIYSDGFVANFGASKGIKQTLEYTNEGFGFGLSMSHDHEKVLDDFIESESLTTGKTYFMGSNNKKGPFMAVIEMQC